MLHISQTILFFRTKCLKYHEMIKRSVMNCRHNSICICTEKNVCYMFNESWLSGEGPVGHISAVVQGTLLHGKLF